MPVDLMDTGAFTSPSPEGQGAVHLPPFVLGNLYTGLMYRGMFCSSMAALLAWDIILTLHTEIRMYRKRGWKWALMPCFLVARYAAPAYVALCVAVVRRGTWTNQSCYNTGRATLFLGTLVSSAATCLFGLRTWSMWCCDHFVLAIVVFLAVAQLVVNLIISSWLRPFASRGGLCVLVMPHHDAFWVTYVVNMSVTAILLALMLACRLLNRHPRIVYTGPLIKQVQMRLMHEGVVYFVCVLLINLLNIIFLLAPELHNWADINASFATSITSICASRLTLHKLTANADWDTLFGPHTSQQHHTSPSTSTSTSNSTTNVGGPTSDAATEKPDPQFADAMANTALSSCSLDNNKQGSQETVQLALPSQALAASTIPYEAQTCVVRMVHGENEGEGEINGGGDTTSQHLPAASARWPLKPDGPTEGDAAYMA